MRRARRLHRYLRSIRQHHNFRRRKVPNFHECRAVSVLHRNPLSNRMRAGVSAPDSSLCGIRDHGQERCHTAKRITMHHDPHVGHRAPERNQVGHDALTVAPATCRNCSASFVRLYSHTTLSWRRVSVLYQFVDTANRPWPTSVAPRGGISSTGQRVARSLPERWPAGARGGSSFATGSRPSTCAGRGSLVAAPF